MDQTATIKNKGISVDMNDSVKDVQYSEQGEKCANPLLSPTENEAMAGEKRQENEAGKMIEKVKTNDSFKKPIIGPIRKPSKQNETITGNKSAPKADPVEASTPQEMLGLGSTELEVETKPSNADDEKQIGEVECAKKAPEEVGDEKLSKSDKLKKLSPAEQAKQVHTALPYLEPKWGGRAEANYSFEVIKNGKIIDNIKLDEKSFYVFGRLPQCDVTMEHPSLSRHHAVVQHCAVPNDRHEVGWYLYDLESTHGTFINKNQVKSRVYYRLKVGHVIKFAGSSRLHILQGPPEDEEEESDLTVTEMKERKMQKNDAELIDGDEDDLSNSKGDTEEDSACSWGMSEDAEEQELEIPFADAIPQHEELYLEDPKKALKGYFEREGYDLPEYQFEEAGHGKHKCIVEVPVDSPSGQPVYAEATVGGKRKDAVVACALEACRILDRYGLLRKKEHEARKVKTRDWEANDYYSSDEDEFLDRTGEIQKKRERRMKRAGKVTETAETYESLCEKLNKVTEEMDQVEKQLEAARKITSNLEGDGLDALDAYMSSIKEGAVDTKTKMALKRRMFDLKKERGQLERLVNIAKPALMPTTSSKSQAKMTSMFGKIGGFTRKIGSKGVMKFSLPISAPVAPVKQSDKKEQVEDMVEKEEEVEKGEEETENQTETTISAVPKEDPKTRLSPPKEENDKSASGQKIQEKHENVASFSTIEAKSKGHPEGEKTSITDQKKVEGGKARQAPKRASSSIQQTLKRLKMKEGKEKEVSKDYCDYDPDYAVWVPPKDQTGDGKTHLNAKFGY